MSYVTIPLTGTGDAIAKVATDDIGGVHFQVMKIGDGIEGSTVVVPALSSAPNSTDAGLLVRAIGGSTVFDVNLTSAGSTRLVGRVTIDSPSTSMELSSGGSTRLVGQVTVANPTTGVSLSSGAILGGSTAIIGEVTPTSVGSTRLIGQVTVANPTTAVTVSSGVILGGGSTANSLGSVALLAGTSANTLGNVTVSNLSTGGGGSTTVDANLTSVGSTKVVGTVNVSSGVILGGSTQMTGLISSGSQTIGTVIMTSGAILGGSTAAIGQLTSGTQTIGSVQLTSAGTTGSIGSVALLAGSSGNIIGTVINGPATTGTLIGNVSVSSGVVLGAGSSANVIGQVAISSANAVYLGLGTSATYNFMQSIPFSSGNTARTTVNTTVDVSIIAANANRKALIIANASTAQRVALGLSTGAVTTGMVNANLFLEPASHVSFGLQGGMPLFLGPIRGINVSSTTVAGGVNVTEFS